MFHGPSNRERPVLHPACPPRRLLCRLGRALQAWDAPLQRMLHSPSALLDSDGTGPGHAVCLFMASCAAIYAAQAMAPFLSCSGQDVLELGACSSLLLGSGRLIALHAPAALQLSADRPAATQWLGRCIAMQSLCLEAMRGLAGLTWVLHAFGRQMAPPEALVDWLRAVVGALQTVPMRAYEAARRGRDMAAGQGSGVLQGPS